MLTTRHTASKEALQIPPYTLNGTTKAQLATLTVASLKSHLKYFKLQVAAALVDHLYSHLAGTWEDVNESPQAATNTEAQGVAAISSQQISVSQNMQSQQSNDYPNIS